jgi:hypothetical protein
MRLSHFFQGSTPVYALLLNQIRVESVELDVLIMHIFKVSCNCFLIASPHFDTLFRHWRPGQGLLTLLSTALGSQALPKSLCYGLKSFSSAVPKILCKVSRVHSS